MGEKFYDVIIIGAGAAGIAAAIELKKKSIPHLIVEARNRVGGRAFTDEETFSPIPVDLGARWIHSFGPDNVLYEYFQRLHGDYDEEQSGTSRNVSFDGKPFDYQSFRRARLLFMDLFDIFDKHVSTLQSEDDCDVQSIIEERYRAMKQQETQVIHFVDFLLASGEQYNAGDLDEFSAKSFMIESSGDCDRSVSFGYGKLMQKIAEEQQINIQLNTAITDIDSTDSDRIVLKTQDPSSILTCQRVIITIPLGCLKRDTIRFQPPLPQWKKSAIQTMGFGLMNKLVFQFDRCFWGERVLSIMHACRKRRGRFRMTTCKPPPANILVFYTTGRFARELEEQTDENICVEVLTFLKEIFPDQEIPQPIRYKITRWSQDPMCYGSYSNFVVGASADTVADLARETAEGRIHWAGEHANVNDGSDTWTVGCVHSAFESGQRAAREILQNLFQRDEDEE